LRCEVFISITASAVGSSVSGVERPSAFCGLEIDHKLELGRLDNWEIGRLSRGAAAMGIITISTPYSNTRPHW
jgi:hypothetical protein